VGSQLSVLVTVYASISRPDKFNFDSVDCALETCVREELVVPGNRMLPIPADGEELGIPNMRACQGVGSRPCAVV